MVKNVRMIQNVGIVDEMDDGRWARDEKDEKLRS
jgi:hypothetical protein